MRDIDQQLIFEAYTSVNNKTINESLLDHIKSKFGNFTTDVVRPYAIKAMQFIAKKDPQLAKKIAQAVQSKDINSLKNILQPGISELTQGAEVNNEAIMDIQNFLRTGLGKGIAGAILALAAFATVTGGLSAAGDGDINADGTIDSVELTGGVDGDISLQEFQHILDEAGVNVLTSSPEDIDTAVSDYMKKGNELEQSMKDALSNKIAL